MSLVFSLAAAEVALRILHHRPLSFDDRAIHQTFWTYKPNSSLPSYVGVPVHINNLGLRGDDAPLTKPANTFRILGVGDSITFGYGVRNEDTFLQVLQRRLNASSASGLRFEALNAGVPATGLEYYAHYVETWGPKLKPDLILVCMALNDIDPDIDSEIREPVVVYSAREKAAASLLAHSYLASSLYVPMKSFLYRANILKLKDNEGFGFLAIGPSSPAQERALAGTKRYLARLAQDAQHLHVPMVVVVFPVEPQISEPTRKMYAEKLHLVFGPEVLEGKPQHWIAEDAAADGMPMLDLLPALRSLPEGTAFLRNKSINVDPVHPSVAGHAAAGEAIASFLEAQHLTPR